MINLNRLRIFRSRGQAALLVAAGLFGIRLHAAQEPFVPLNGQTPQLPAMNIAGLLAWDPATDPISPFNVSAVPLAQRIEVGPALKENANARAGQGRIMSLDLYSSSSSGSRPQCGAGTNYLFNYWQYVSSSVYWGGSSARPGVVQIPGADIIDAAHRNGVPMMGLLFFAPGVYGGNFSEVQLFLQKNGNRYPAADKLIQMAEYFGFDGWFINQETEGGSVLDAVAMRELVQYVRANSNIQIIWYDSMTEAGQILWQDQLNAANDAFLRFPESPVGTRGAESIFLDFVVNAQTVQTSRNHAKLVLGLDPFANVFAGFEMQSGWYAGGTTDRQDLRTVFPDGQDHIVSAGLFLPGAHTATYLHTQDEFWVGLKRDPRDTSTPVGAGNWHGIAHNIAAMSPVTSVPFGTSFGLGAGNNFWIRGENTHKPQWWNRSVQDVLPTWRWIVDSPGNKLGVGLSMDDAYFGGGCLRLSGNLNADNTVRLYLANLPVKADTVLKAVFKRGLAGVDSQLQVGISLASAPTDFHYFDAGFCASTGWNSTQIPLGAFAGQTIAAIGLKVLASPAVSNYDLKVGQLVISNQGDPVPEPPSNVTLLEQAPGGSAGTSDLHLRWTHAPGERQYYNVYERDANGSLRYLGSTPNRRFFIEDAPVSASPQIVVITVGKDYALSAPSDGLYFQDLSARKNAFQGATVGRVDVAKSYDGFDTFAVTGGTGAALFDIEPTTGRVFVKNATALASATAGNYTLTANSTGKGAASIAVTVRIVLRDATADGVSGIVRQFWWDFNGALDQLPSRSGYPYAPDEQRVLGSLDAGSVGIGYFGSRIRALVIPPVTGNYSFFISSDDESALYLGTSEDPATAAYAAGVPAGWIDPRSFTAQGWQNSGPRTLIAGKRYYLEVRHRQGVGGDDLAVGWTTPSNGTPTVIPGNALKPYDLNEPPVWNNAPYSFSTVIGTVAGTVVGTVTANDPEAEPVSYSILSGDPNGNFVIHPTSGAISVINGNTLPAGSTVQLSIGAQDAGIGGAYPLKSATIQVPITILGSIAFWRSQQFGNDAGNAAIAGERADPDRDGLANLLEYALGLDPKSASRNPMTFDIETIANQRYLRLRVVKNPAATDVTLRAESSHDLVTDWSTNDVVVEIDNANLLQARDAKMMSQNPARFIRLKATIP